MIMVLLEINLISELLYQNTDAVCHQPVSRSSQDLVNILFRCLRR